MLTEIYCDKFQKNGEVRGPIRFRPGLNVVLGDEQASNSVGKSTFMLVIAFALGFDDYVKKCSDVQKQIGKHAVCFAFSFDGQEYYFKRETGDLDHVIRCAKGYEPMPEYPPMTMSEYYEFLTTHYGFDPDKVGWSDVMGRFIRVHKRATLNVDAALASTKAKDETNEVCVSSFMKFWGCYDKVKEVSEQLAEANEKNTAIKNAVKHDLIQLPKDAKGYRENLAEADRLEAEMQESQFCNETDAGDLDLAKTQALAPIRGKLLVNEREIASIEKQLAALHRDKAGEAPKIDYEGLQEFFLNVNIPRIDMFESFHKGISKAVHAEIEAEEKELTMALNQLKGRSEELRQKMIEIGTVPNVPQVILLRYAEMSRRLDALKASNKYFLEAEDAKVKAKELEAGRDKVFAEQLSEMSRQLNQEMLTLTGKITGNEHCAPVIELPKSNKYHLGIPGDTGTGAGDRALITFDLANLSLTQLPCIVHDSLLLKQIEKKYLAGIVREYAGIPTGDQQVFAAVDLSDLPDEETRQIIRRAEVLELGPNGNELFGKAWNK